MKAKTIIIMFALSLIFLFFTGCIQSPGEGGWQPVPDTRQSDSDNLRFQPGGSQGPSAVESAIELSDKYARLSEEASTLKQQNQELSIENKQLKENQVSCRSKLEQAEKELGEANDLLLEMRLELNNWKDNVLGFRDEMRDAEKTQLEALYKILKLLGGEEITEESEVSKPAGNKSSSPVTK